MRISQFTTSAVLVLFTCLTAGCSERESNNAPPKATPPANVEVPAVELDSRSADHSSQALNRTNVPPETEEQIPIAERTLYRTSQPDPQLNPTRLAAAGIHAVESERLILLTDRDPASVRDIPPLADALFNVLEQQCGQLRPAPSGAPFRAIGYLMADMERFQAAGLVPNAVLDMRHGEQSGYRFWAHDQQTDYYRRHLVLHEFVHAYMTVDTAQGDVPERWFIEGAAEFFATHFVSADPPEFGVIPTTFEGFEDWGRISAIRRRRHDRPSKEIELQELPSLEDVFNENTGEGGEDGKYSWWWALAWMLSEHPEYSASWNKLCHCRGTAEFQQDMSELMETKGRRLRTDWLLFVESLSESFDTERSFPIHGPVATSSRIEVTLSAEKGWQDTGWELMPGESISLSCSGQCVLNETTGPWIAEPNGITLEYNQGCPIGEVVAVLVTSDGQSVSRRIKVGLNGQITATQPSRLWLQINDDAGQRSNNSGEYVVSIQSESTSSGDAD